MYDPKEYNKIDSKPINDKWDMKPCMNKSHDPPSHMLIRAGQTYIHTCPGCGRSTTLKGPNLYYL